MAKIGVYNETQSSFTCYVYDLDLSYTNDNNRYVEWHIVLNGSYFAGPITSPKIDAGVYEGGYTTISGLKSNTTYVIYAYIYYNNGADYAEPDPIAATTLSGSSAQTYSIIMSVDPSGSGNATASSSSATPGSIVTISATANYGYTFLGWSYLPNTVQVDNYLSSKTSFIMPSAPVLMIANFTANTQTRPAKFYWTTSKVSGGTFNLTATEWNGLCENINLVRAYKGLTAYSFTTAYPGEPFSASMYNQAVYAIQDVPGYGSYLYIVNPKQTITAYCMNILVSELNAIP